MSLRPHRVNLVRFAKLHGKVSGTCVGNLGSMTSSSVARHMFERQCERRTPHFRRSWEVEILREYHQWPEAYEAAPDPLPALRRERQSAAECAELCLCLRQPSKLAAICIELSRLRPEGHVATASC